MRCQTRPIPGHDVARRSEQRTGTDLMDHAERVNSTRSSPQVPTHMQHRESSIDQGSTFRIQEAQSIVNRTIELLVAEHYTARRRRPVRCNIERRISGKRATSYAAGPRPEGLMGAVFSARKTQLVEA